MYRIKEKVKYMEQINFEYCDDNKYEKVEKIGQGTFGEVFKARERKNPEKYVAMKKMYTFNEDNDLPITTLREIYCLQLLKDNINVVNLIELCRTKSTYLIFELCEHDLEGLLTNHNVKFKLEEIKKVLMQLLSGLFYIHRKKVIHRDIKPANILITKTGILKLADFGLARDFCVAPEGVANSYTNGVVSMWYRPPELLLGDKNYGPPVDLWSAGCIMAEMWTKFPIMHSNTEQGQLSRISQLCGSISPEIWPGVENLDLYKSMELPKGNRRQVKEFLQGYVKDSLASDLFDQLLMLDPSKRIDADTALNHDFFWVHPLPSDLSEMLAQHSQSMFQYSAL